MRSVPQRTAVCYTQPHEGDPYFFIKEKHFFDDYRRCSRGVRLYTDYWSDTLNATRSRYRERRGCTLRIDATPLVAASGGNLALAFTRAFYTFPHGAPPRPHSRAAALQQRLRMRSVSWLHSTSQRVGANGRCAAQAACDRARADAAHELIVPPSGA